MPRLVGDGVETLDLSSSPHVTDTALRYLAAHGGTRHSLRHISVAATSVTLLGLGPLLRDCERLSHLDVSHCRGLVADKFETVLPTRRIPDAWEDEYVAGEWRDGRALRTLVWQGIPAAVLARLEAGFPWIEVNPPDWRASPFDQAALRAELLVPACLWVRPRQAEELAREAARERARAEEEQAAGRWGDLLPLPRRDGSPWMTSRFPIPPSRCSSYDLAHEILRTNRHQGRAQSWR